jgi:F-type H+-transporting ATPase subunit gamma
MTIFRVQIEPDGEETLANMEEYAVASALYFALLETTACETSQRVTAMENASTNAKDMVDRFKLLYNRARQSKITTELTEIISGAEASQASSISD